MRSGAEGAGNIAGTVARLEDRINDLRMALTVQDRTVDTITRQVEELRQALTEIRGAVGEVESSFSGETRSLRDLLNRQLTQIGTVGDKVNQMDSSQSGVSNMVEQRLKTLSQQVTISVSALALVVLVSVVIMVVLQ